ncbi:MAG: phosphocholine cytidylyltransferase family protein [Bryobacteraceae bacterium]
MRGIVLAAGRGSRMKNLTDDRPKCLIEVRGRPLLEWQITALREAGISEIAIVTGYRREMLTGWGLTEFHNPRWEETNMVSSLACARAWLEAEPCIVSYSDIFFESPAVKLLMDSTTPLAIAYDPNWRALWTRRFGDPLLDAETFRLNPDGTLAEIGGKPQSADVVEGQYMGLLRFTPEGWKEVLRIRSVLTPAECDTMHMTGTLQKIIEAGKSAIWAVPYTGLWGEIDSAEDLAAFRP